MMKGSNAKDAETALEALQEEGLAFLSPEGQAYVQERVRQGDAIVGVGQNNFGGLRNLGFGSALGDAWQPDIAAWVRANPDKSLPLGYHMNPQQHAVAEDRGDLHAIRVSGGAHVVTADIPLYDRAGRFEFARRGVLHAGSQVVPLRRWYGFTLVSAQSDGGPETFAWIRTGSPGVEEVFYTDTELVPDRVVRFHDPFWLPEDRHDVYWTAYHREPGWFVRNMDERRIAEFRQHGGRLEHDRALVERERAGAFRRGFDHREVPGSHREGSFGHEPHGDGHDHRGGDSHADDRDHRGDEHHGDDMSHGSSPGARGSGGDAPSHASVPAPARGPSQAPSDRPAVPAAVAPSQAHGPGGGGGAPSPSPSDGGGAHGGGGGHGLHGADVGDAGHLAVGQRGHLSASSTLYGSPGSSTSHATPRQGVGPAPAGTSVEIVEMRRGQGGIMWIYARMPGSAVGTSAPFVAWVPYTKVSTGSVPSIVPIPVRRDLHYPHRRPAVEVPVAVEPWRHHHASVEVARPYAEVVDARGPEIFRSRYHRRFLDVLPAVSPTVTYDVQPSVEVVQPTIQVTQPAVEVVSQPVEVEVEVEAPDVADDEGDTLSGLGDAGTPGVVVAAASWYDAPNTVSLCYGVLPQGTPVRVYGSSGGMTQVGLADTVGWAHDDRVRVGFSFGRRPEGDRRGEGMRREELERGRRPGVRPGSFRFHREGVERERYRRQWPGWRGGGWRKEKEPEIVADLEGRLVQATGDAKVYVVRGGQRHWIHDPAVFSSMGFEQGSVISVDPELLARIPDGKPYMAATDIAGAPSPILSDEDVAIYQEAYRTGRSSWIVSGAIPTENADRVRLFQERRELLGAAASSEGRPELGTVTGALNSVQSAWRLFLYTLLGTWVVGSGAEAIGRIFHGTSRAPLADVHVKQVATTLDRVHRQVSARPATSGIDVGGLLVAGVDVGGIDALARELGALYEAPTEILVPDEVVLGDARSAVSGAAGKVSSSVKSAFSRVREAIAAEGREISRTDSWRLVLYAVLGAWVASTAGRAISDILHGPSRTPIARIHVDKVVDTLEQNAQAAAKKGGAAALTALAQQAQRGASAIAPTTVVRRVSGAGADASSAPSRSPFTDGAVMTSRKFRYVPGSVTTTLDGGRTTMRWNVAEDGVTMTAVGTPTPATAEALASAKSDHAAATPIQGVLGGTSLGGIALGSAAEDAFSSSYFAGGADFSAIDDLAEELAACYPAPMGLAGADGDDLLGVGLASFATPNEAARELVRVAFRAAPRDWRDVSDEHARALDAYPALGTVPVLAGDAFHGVDADDLAPLGFGVSEGGELLSLDVPSWIAGASPRLYAAELGDTPASIASRFGVSDRPGWHAELAQANPETSWAHVLEGQSVAIPPVWPDAFWQGAVEGTPVLAPRGWVPGRGPSEQAEETFRKLSADWEGFDRVGVGSAVLSDLAADVVTWRGTREAWRRGDVRATEIGSVLDAEVDRARRVRRGLRDVGAVDLGVALKELPAHALAYVKEAPSHARASVFSVEQWLEHDPKGQLTAKAIGLSLVGAILYVFLAPAHGRGSPRHLVGKAHRAVSRAF